MEDNRRNALILGTIFVLALIFFMLGAVYIVGFPERFFWLGCALGVGLGLITWAYLLLSWDPVTLSPRNGRNDKVMGWAGVAIMGGAIGSRIVVMIFGEEIQSFVIGSLGTWLVWTFNTMVIMAWWYRPK